MNSYPDSDFGKIIEEYVAKTAIGHAIIWEEKLRLHVKPKPAWCPDLLWAKICSLVLVQSKEIQ